MKKLVSIIALVASLSVASAQDGVSIMPDMASTSAGRVLELLANSPDFQPNTNLTMVLYASHAKGLVDSAGDAAEWGGGIAVVQPLNGYASAGLRVQYLAGEVYVPSLTLNVQTTKNLFGIPKLFITTFGFSGAVLPIGGLPDNGNASLTYGIGTSIKYRFTDTFEAGFGYGLEYWPGLNVNRIEHFGPVLNWFPKNW